MFQAIILHNSLLVYTLTMYKNYVQGVPKKLKLLKLVIKINLHKIPVLKNFTKELN